MGSPTGPTVAERVGFIGAGSVGAPMVRRLLAGGVQVQLYARRAEVAERFAALGAAIQPSVSALAAAADVVILCPFSEEQLDAIVGGEQGLFAHAAPGTVVVQHATVSATGIRRIAADASSRGITVLDAPVSGRTDQIEAGALTVLLGGDPIALKRAETVLRHYSGAVLHTGEVGTATVVKLVNNLTFAAHVQIAGAAVELGERLGVPPSELLGALTACSANSFAFGALAAIGDISTFAERAAPYLRKDVELARRAAAELGVDTGQIGEVIRSGRFDLT